MDGALGEGGGQGSRSLWHQIVFAQLVINHRIQQMVIVGGQGSL